MLDQALQTVGRASAPLTENQKFGRVFKKLGRVFVLQHAPCCPSHGGEKV